MPGAESIAKQRGGAHDEVGGWQLLGPVILSRYWGMNSGRIAALAVDPTDANTVFGASILWAATTLHGTFVSAARLTAIVQASEIAAGGTAPVDVSNPAPGGGSSGVLTFTVNSPVPVLKTLPPGSATHGGAAFTLTLFGSNIQKTSTVLWKARRASR